MNPSIRYPAMNAADARPYARIRIKERQVMDPIWHEGSVPGGGR
jgi:hypothetical protein